MRLKLLILSLLIPASAFAAPIKIPALSMCINNTTGVVAVKQRCAKTETKGSYANLQGNQGAPGILNLAACNTVTADCGMSGAGACAVTCGSGKFALQHSAITDSTQAFPSGLLFIDRYSNGLAAGVSYGFSSFSVNFNAHVEAVCCPVS